LRDKYLRFRRVEGVFDLGSQVIDPPGQSVVNRR